jgi:dinuclear metal center YbgI/SA1388 family protein
MIANQLGKIVAYCDRTLRTDEITDYDGAKNGLQVENSGRVTGIAAAVDASLATVRMAIEAKADLLVVHHGLFWSPTVPWTGKRYELLRLLLDHNLAVYSSHLPLDLHPKLGNNACLAAGLGLRAPKPFFSSKGQFLGWKAKVNITRSVLVQQLETLLEGPVKLLPGGGEQVRSLGICSGGAGAELVQVAREEVDTFITGEGPHWSFPLAEELGLNVLHGGHYATETFGVKALSAALSKKFKVPWQFLDHPSGL